MEDDDVDKLESDHDFEKLSQEHGVEKLRSKTPRDVLSVWVLLELYDYERLLRIVSLLVSKNRIQEVNKRFVPEQRSPPVPAFVFEYVLCICIPEQVLAATPHKTPTVRPPAPYHENYSS